MPFVEWMVQVVKSVLDWSIDVDKIRRKRCRGWDFVNLLERYNDQASQNLTNQNLLARNTVAREALESVKGEIAPDVSYYRCLELIAASPPLRKEVFAVLTKRTTENGDVDAASLLGQLAEPSDFQAGVFEGVQGNLLLRYAHLHFTLQHKDDVSLSALLSCLADELDSKESVDEETRDSILKLLAHSDRRLDPEAAFRTLCALRIPEATQQAAEMFFRSPEELSGAVLGQIAMSDWKSGGAKPAILEEIANSEALTTAIREGKEDSLRKVFEGLQFHQGESAAVVQKLCALFENCAAGVELERQFITAREAAYPASAGPRNA